MKFRVFCKNKNEYEKDVCFLAENGDLFTLHNNVLKPLLKETHTVEMSTGLKDKNGVEIFEGDQVRCEYGYCGSPKMHNRTIIYIAEYKQGQYYGLCDSEIYSMEIVGNIHGEADDKD